MHSSIHLHQRGIGVILDWVPSHFPTDEHGLVYFDGTHLYEHADPRQGFHPEWKSCIFNYGRNEVRSFLAVERAVLARQVSHRRPARRRGRLDALPRLRPQGRRVDPEPARRPREPRGDRLPAPAQRGASTATTRTSQTIAEESTAWPMVSRPVDLGGLGFGMKWNMGWMHDTLDYIAQDPVHRKYHHDQLTFSLWYAFNENFVLPLSHDEVVHGKGSLLGKMPGDDVAEVRQPARCCSATCGRIRARSCCSWAASSASGASGRTTASSTGSCSSSPMHGGVQRWVGDLNRVYATQPALHAARLRRTAGFEWIDCRRRRAERARVSCASARTGSDLLLVVCNFTPVPRDNYRVGVPQRRTLARAAQQRRTASTAAAGRATWAASKPRRCRRTAGSTRCRSRCRRSRVLVFSPVERQLDRRSQQGGAAATRVELPPSTGACAPSSRTCSPRSTAAASRSSASLGDRVRVEADASPTATTSVALHAALPARGPRRTGRSRDAAARQRPLARQLRGRPRSAATATRSSPGSIASCPGATSSSAASMPADILLALQGRRGAPDRRGRGAPRAKTRATARALRPGDCAGRAMPDARQDIGARRGA